MPQSAMQKGRLTILAGCTAALVVSLCALRADLMVSHGFSKAFGTQGAPQSFDVTALSGTLQNGGDLVSLTRSEDGGLPHFVRRLAIGDRITVSGRVLVVVDIKPSGDPLTRVASDAPPQRLVVICRVIGGSNDPDAQARVEFTAQGHAVEPPTLPPSAPKTL